MQYIEFIFIIILIISIFSFLSLAPWVPTKNNDLKRIHNTIKLKSGESFLEIGCGTARVSLFIAKNNPDSKIIGIELSPLLFLISKLKILFSQHKNIKIIYGNALTFDISTFDIIYIFGLPDTLKNKLLPKIKNEMKSTAKFVSYCFRMENDSFKEEKFKEKNRNNIYVYKK